jgi:leader peptidase (prepilin peptidase) / N-methyltransferase
VSDDLVTALVCALVGALGGLFVPRLIALVPEPERDPDEDADAFPDKVLYVDLAARPRLALYAAIACALAAGAMGAVVDETWWLPWLVFLVPVSCALTVIDYVTWYLPRYIVLPSYVIVLVLVGTAAVGTGDWSVLVAAGLGWLGLGTYYLLIWFVSPRVMAYGDVRFAGLLGLALGPLGPAVCIVSVFAAGVLGVLALPALRLVGNSIKRHAPYGPFLALGALVAVLVSDPLVELLYG